MLILLRGFELRSTQEITHISILLFIGINTQIFFEMGFRTTSWTHLHFPQGLHLLCMTHLNGSCWSYLSKLNLTYKVQPLTGQVLTLSLQDSFDESNISSFTSMLTNSNSKIAKVKWALFGVLGITFWDTQVEIALRLIFIYLFYVYYILFFLHECKCTTCT